MPDSTQSTDREAKLLAAAFRLILSWPEPKEQQEQPAPADPKRVKPIRTKEPKAAPHAKR